MSCGQEMFASTLFYGSCHLHRANDVLLQCINQAQQALEHCKILAVTPATAYIQVSFRQPIFNH